jgi:FtsP/CotA-like multicopper oxidase with cupredoxin domain
MKRRAFLSSTIGAAAAPLFARSVFAQGESSTMHMASGASGMADMPAMPGGMMSSPVPLAAADVLQSGAPLTALRTLANESREAGRFQATLVAHAAARPMLPGQPDTVFWQYDAGVSGAAGAPDIGGPVIGPLIDVREGDTVEIRFVNNLPQPSTIHWHGLPVPPDQDGNPSDPIAPGAQRIYRFTLPVGSAGTYWYHPHPHMQTSEQVFRGLAGPIVVGAADDPLAAWPERHLFVTDLKIAADGTIPANGMMDWMNGREGQFVLVNGTLRPQIALTHDERWRVWNGCNARYLMLAFDDGRPFAQVGSDGGLLAAPRDGLTSLLLAPGERAELIVRAGALPARARLVAARYDRRKMAMSHGSVSPEPTRVLADVSFMPSAAASPALPARLREIAPLGQPRARKTVVLSEAMDMKAMHQPGASSLPMPRGMAFMVNGAVFDPQRITLTSRRGDVEHWSIENRTDMDHPFHLHGTQFQVLMRERDGGRTKEPYLAWRDTVNVEPGETVHIATVQHDAGDRMFHCHILEHEDLGMMGTLRVI